MTASWRDLLPDIFSQAEAQPDIETCGVIVQAAARAIYWPCRNVHPQPDRAFELSPQDFAAAEEAGDILAVVHSHRYLPVTASMADRHGCEASGVPWLIVNLARDCQFIQPDGYRAPLIGRPYVWRLFDCFTLIRDYYRETLGIMIDDFGGYPYGFWEAGQDLYRDRFHAAGFVPVNPEDIREHDVLLMQLEPAPIASHAGIYLGNHRFLHHLAGRLSGRTIYGGYYLDRTLLIGRHQSLC